MDYVICALFLGVVLVLEDGDSCCMSPPIVAISSIF